MSHTEYPTKKEDEIYRLQRQMDILEEKQKNLIFILREKRVKTFWLLVLAGIIILVITNLFTRGDYIIYTVIGGLAAFSVGLWLIRKMVFAISPQTDWMAFSKKHKGKDAEIALELAAVKKLKDMKFLLFLAATARDKK